MLARYHIEMTQLALDDVFSSRALAEIIRANLRQDHLRGQIGHPEYHFDHNAFENSYAFIEEQRGLIVSSLMANRVRSAWSAFGRLTHTVQDFYAHSNYIDLWLTRQAGDMTPANVDAMDPDVLDSVALRSGKIYFLELLTIIPPLKPLVMPLLPRDSHAWMNLDASERGPNFPYAFQGAVKRTKIEFERTTKELPEELCMLFVDKEIDRQVHM
jgi:hypothetical protein